MNALQPLRNKRESITTRKIAFDGAIFLQVQGVEAQSASLVDAPMALLFRVQRQGIPEYIFGIINKHCLDRELQQALAAEALVGVLRCQMCTSSRREFHACTLALSGILVLANKRRTTARTRLVFHSCYIIHIIFVRGIIAFSLQK